MTYNQIVDEICEYYTECFMNELEETNERNYEKFVDILIDENFNVTQYSTVFEQNYDYRDINMPATIQMMNFILEQDDALYTLLASGCRDIISVFAYYIVMEAICGDLNYEDKFKEHWRRMDEEEEEEEEDEEEDEDHCKCQPHWDMRCMCDPLQEPMKYSKCPMRFVFAYECIKNTYDAYKDIEASVSRSEKFEKICDYARAYPYNLCDENLDDELFELFMDDMDKEG